MPKRICLRELTAEEKKEIRRLVASRKEAHRLVQLARIIVAMLDDPGVTASEAGLQAGFRSKAIGPLWVKRFNVRGWLGCKTGPDWGGDQAIAKPSAVT